MADDSLFEFPCDFPIKIMGVHDEALRRHVEQVTLEHQIDTLDITERASAAGNFLAITLTIRAQSRQQLDELYIALGASSYVKAML